METNDSFEDEEVANDAQPCDASIILLLKWAPYTTTSLSFPVSGEVSLLYLHKPHPHTKSQPLPFLVREM